MSARTVSVIVGCGTIYNLCRKGFDEKRFYDTFNAGLVDTKLVSADQVVAAPSNL